MGIDIEKLSVQELLDLKAALEKLNDHEEKSGTEKWFVPDTPYSIDKYPKHKMYFDSGAKYTERVFLCGNRCLAESTLVATPTGPVEIQNIKTGDIVYDCYGEETRVTGVYYNGERETVSMQNRGKEYFRCTPDHELDVITVTHHARKWDYSSNVRVGKVAGSLTDRDFVRRVYVKSELGSVRFEKAYAVAAMLGDGCCTCGNLSNIVLSSADSLVPDKVSAIVGGEAPRKCSSNYNWKIKVDPISIGSEYLAWCHNKLCHEKVVDLSIVKTWDRESCLEFVAGLIDTDGSMSSGKDGATLQFHNQSKTAVDAFVYLCSALWQETPTVKVDDRPRYKNGPVYRASVRNPHAILRISSELEPHVVHKRKVDVSRVTGGLRSRPDAIKLTAKPGRLEKVYDISVEHPERFFLLANGISVHNCGKSQAGGLEVAYHLTGEYPDWWNGRRFEHPIDVWVAGKDKITTRDTIQHILMGGIGQLGTGTIPAKNIERTWSMQGVPNGIELAQIRHKSGGLSTIGFKSYDRGVDSFFGTARHLIWLDEEVPEDVYNECLIRTMTTNGMIMATFTPLKGLTPLVLHLCSTADFLGAESFVERDQTVKHASRCVVMASWDDAPHLTEEAKRKMLDSTPPYLREARSKGVPQVGEGTIYPISKSEVECDAFEIPKHWKRWYGLDVGWNCTAAVFFAENPDTKEVYVVGEYRGERAEPIIHAEGIKRLGGDWMIGAIDPASHSRSHVDGQKLINIYRNYGLKVVHANNAVESGIAAVWEALSTGKLKIFKHCNRLFSEYMVYRRENGQIKKTNDHLMDALRYGFNTRQIGSVKQSDVSTSSSYAMKLPF